MTTCAKCKLGRLFEVKEWFASDREIDHSFDLGGRKDPLVIAVDKGFHSLAQVLLEGGLEISEPAFSLAVWRRRLDIVELFFRFGAPVDLIPFSEVVETTDKDMVHLFIEKGGDFKTGWPLAFGLKRAPKRLSEN